MHRPSLLPSLSMGITFVALTSLLPAPARAESPVRPECGSAPRTFETAVSPEEIGKLYGSGKSKELQEQLAILLADTKKAVADTEKDGPTTDYASVVFVYKDAVGDPAPLRLIAGPKASSVLPGVTSFYQVFLSTSSATLSSEYVVTRQRNPVETALPKFLVQLVGPAAGAMKGLAAGGKEEPKKALASVCRVQLPFTRTSIAISDAVTVPPTLDLQKLRDRAAKIAADQRAREGMVSERTMALIGSLEKTCDLLSAQAAAASTDPKKVLVPRCEKEEGRDSCQLLDLLATAYAATLKRPECVPDDNANGGEGQSGDPAARKPAGCVDRTAVGAREAETAAIATVYKAFTALAGKDGTYKGTSTLTNQPPTIFTLGLMAGAAIRTGVNDRVKLDNGSLAANPLSGALTVAVVNIHPWGYDATKFDMELGERFRFFIGGVLTPEFGVAGGAGVGIVRGLSLNAGYGLLVIHALHAGDRLGSAPAKLSSPFRKTLGGVFFLSLGYNFE